ncbi:hypothetical protein [Microcoleus sp. AT9_A5]
MNPGACILDDEGQLSVVSQLSVSCQSVVTPMTLCSDFQIRIIEAVTLR